MRSPVAERWIVNASPLIVLAKVGQLDLLSAIADEVRVPRGVAEEVVAGPSDDPARVWLDGQKQIIVDVPAPRPELSAWDLGAGETAVLAYALANPGWTAIIDDNAARKCARSFAIPVKGTLAVIIRARQKGLIPSAANVLRQLQDQGFRISNHIIREALRRTVDEAW